MTLSLYNTLTGEQEPFVPLRPGRVGMYVCGPTVYDHAHIGHARSAVFFDVMARYLAYRGYAVTFVRNYTDIDDKIVERALLLDTGARELAEEYIRAYRRDMDALGVPHPDFEPRVTGHIADVMAMITLLIEKDAAYVSGGNVFYRTRVHDDYGLLGGAVSEKSVTEGFRVPCEGSKESGRDFVIWKTVRDRGPAWDSPWGRGRPGWHVECAAMSTRFLGPVFDIHGGGRDLIFPHHENERAICRSVTGADPARYWVHHGLVTANGKKLSKSDSTQYRIRDLCLAWHPEAIRLFLLSTHYRRPLDFTTTGLAGSASALDRLYGFLQRYGGPPEPKTPGSAASDSFTVRFCNALDSDFNIPACLAALFAALRRLNRCMNITSGSRGLSDTEQAEICDIYSVCRNVLGILAHSPGDYFGKRRTEITSPPRA